MEENPYQAPADAPQSPRLQLFTRGTLWVAFWTAVSVTAWVVEVWQIQIGPRGFMAALPEHYALLILRWTSPFAIVAPLFSGRWTPIGRTLWSIPAIMLLILLLCCFVPG